MALAMAASKRYDFAEVRDSLGRRGDEGGGA
jgi:hypothetical protein